MWPWIFSKLSQKKVLLHTGHLQKSVYVVFSQVGDFNIPAKWTPMTHNVKPHIHFSCSSNFGLKFLWHNLPYLHCNIIGANMQCMVKHTWREGHEVGSTKRVKTFGLTGVVTLQATKLQVVTLQATKLQSKWVPLFRALCAPKFFYDTHFFLSSK